MGVHICRVLFYLLYFLVRRGFYKRIIIKKQSKPDGQEVPPCNCQRRQSENIPWRFSQNLQKNHQNLETYSPLQYCSYSLSHEEKHSLNSNWWGISFSIHQWGVHPHLKPLLFDLYIICVVHSSFIHACRSVIFILAKADRLGRSCHQLIVMLPMLSHTNGSTLNLGRGFFDNISTKSVESTVIRKNQKTRKAIFTSQQSTLRLPESSIAILR